MKMNSLRWLLCSSVLLMGIITVSNSGGPDPLPHFGEPNRVMISPVSLAWYSVDERSREILMGIPLESTAPRPGDIDPQFPLGPGQQPADPAPEEPSIEVPQDAGVAAATWTVRPGDSIWKIAREVLGSSDRFLEIVRANADINTDRLKVGQVIKLPAGSGGSSAQVSPADAVTTTAREHVVSSGESLASIAKHYYGVEDWQRLLDANRDRISRPERLSIGTVLRIPARTTVGREGDDR